MQFKHIVVQVSLATGALLLSAAASAGEWKTTVIEEAAAMRAGSSGSRSVLAVKPSPGHAAPVQTGSIAHLGADVYTPSAGRSVTGDTHALSGIASYYWQGQTTATGEVFDKRALTAAHKTLPFGTKVRVTRVDTGDSVVVRINDRGPFKPGRVIDLSERAAEEIRMTGHGLTAVKLEVLGK